MWVDTCCIDKRSSAELSEAINSMFRWYENSSICYAYLHDVSGPLFPTARNNESYANSNGWPEWFSRGWTLQEMIAPRDVQFFNKDWHPIGAKRILSPILESITRVPQHILQEGPSSNRPCVAQIMSWAANRTTTRVEDRAYSLMGLLDVNMPMLYGEGKKAFHRLQLEIIRTSNDQSIFAWGCNSFNVRTGSILADDPSLFQDCDKMELINQDEFIEYVKKRNPKDDLPSTEDDRFGTFPITNRGIQIWLFLHPQVSSESVFHALLPCRSDPSDSPVVINLALWESNYYRHGGRIVDASGGLQLRQVFLRYQDTPHCNSTFEIDDSAITKKSFTYSPTRREEIITGSTVTLSITNPLCLNVYFGSSKYHFALGFGQCLGQNWIHVIPQEPGSLYTMRNQWPWYGLAMLGRAPEYAQAMKNACSGAASCQVCIMEIPLPESVWVLQISCVMWKRSSRYGVKLEAFCDLSRSNPKCQWIGFDVDVSRSFFVHPHYYLIGIDITNREQTIPTVTGGVS